MALTNYRIDTVLNSIFPSNTYIITDVTKGESLIIDPGLDTIAIHTKIAQLSLNPVGIVATHGHFDHIGSVSDLKDTFQIPYFLHEADLKISKSANFYLKMVRLQHKIVTPIPDMLIKGLEQQVEIGSFSFNCYNFPGHTDGSCLLQFGDIIFSGDLIYKRGLGFNHFPGENKDKLRESIIQIFDLLPGETMMYPGHGEPALLSGIKTENEELSNFLNLNKQTK